MVTAVVTSSVGTLETSNARCPGYVFDRTLRYGMRGTDVMNLQKLMNCLGFTLSSAGAGSPGQETEYFSNRTEQSVRKFQDYYVNDVLQSAGLKKSSGIFAEYSKKKAASLTVQ